MALLIELYVTFKLDFQIGQGVMVEWSRASNFRWLSLQSVGSIPGCDTCVFEKDA